MRGENAKRLTGVLAQCPSLAHLNLSDNGGWFRGQDIT